MKWIKDKQKKEEEIILAQQEIITKNAWDDFGLWWETMKSDNPYPLTPSVHETVTIYIEYLKARGDCEEKRANKAERNIGILEADFKLADEQFKKQKIAMKREEERFKSLSLALNKARNDCRDAEKRAEKTEQALTKANKHIEELENLASESALVDL
jgi:hypothetical protein